MKFYNQDISKTITARSFKLGQFIEDNSPLGETLENKFRCTPLGTKVAIYYFVGNFMLKSIGNVVNLTTCAEIV